jgi:hypothetical protein
MSTNENQGKPAEYQRTGAPGPGSPEYEAMDAIAKMFEKQVAELRGPQTTDEPPAEKH